MRNNKEGYSEYIIEKDVFDEKLLWNNIMSFSETKYFWKDAERRFAGASRSFLEYYGLESAEELIGKTDEDMGWHIDPEPYRKDEESVLRDGTYSLNVHGKCIIKGVVHNIRAYKMPIYQYGEIVGLMGYFIDEDAISPEEHGKSLATVDRVTGLSNTRGVMEGFQYYSEKYEADKIRFVTTGIEVEGYEALKARHGDEVGNVLLKRIAGILHAHFPTEATIGRVSGSKFMVICQEKLPGQMSKVQDLVKSGIASVDMVEGKPCHLIPYLFTSDATTPRALEESMVGFWAKKGDKTARTTRQIIEILGSEYDCLVYLNMRSLEARRFKNGGILGDTPITDYESFWNAFSHYVEEHVSKESRSDLLNLGGLDTIRQRLSSQKSLELEYLNDINHYCAVRIVKLESPGSAAQHVVIAFTDRDADVRARNANDLLEHYNLEIKRILVSEYDSVYLIQSETGKVLASKVGVANVKHYESESIESPGYYDTYRDFVQSRVMESYRDMMLETGTMDYLREALRYQKSLETTFQSDDGQYCMRKVIKVGTDNAEPTELLMCFVNKDSEIRQRLKLQLERDDYLKEVERQKNQLEKQHEDLKAAHKETKYASEHDALTGLYNRHMFVKELREIRHGQHTYFCLVNLDVNGLKRVNDNLGHHEGDALICAAAEAITNVFGELGHCFRTGGDEFEVILIDKIVDEKELYDKLKEECKKWKGHFDEELSISMGMACSSPEHLMTYREVMDKADQDMYADKRLYYATRGQDRRKERSKMNKQELAERIMDLRATFDNVRLVDIEEHRAIRYDQEGVESLEKEACFAAWGKSEACENCVSERACHDHRKHTKIEVLDGQAYFVSSQYITIDDRPALLEVIQKMEDTSELEKLK